MSYKLKDRKVEITKTDLEIGEGVYVLEANYIDNGEPLTEEEINEVEAKYQDDLYADAYSDHANWCHEQSEGMER